MAANTFTQAFVTGASNANQQTAQSAFQTALAAIATYQGSPITIINSGLEVSAPGSTPANSYTFWAFIQYYSAS